MNPNRDASEPAGKRQVPRVLLDRIVSGGQTGADRAALDFAIEHGIPQGGWCPQGRLSEDGQIGETYALQETPEPDYPQRTEWNVRDSDGTVIFSIAPELGGGSRLTAEFAATLGKPCLHLSADLNPVWAAEQLKNFVIQNRIRILNVAGPRASVEPAVYDFVRNLLSDAIERPGRV